MKNTASLQSVATVANAVELVAGIAKEVLGNDVADMVQGTELNSDAVRSIAATQIQAEFTHSIRGGQ